jgi:hypothetical protein
MTEPQAFAAAHSVMSPIRLKKIEINYIADKMEFILVNINLVKVLFQARPIETMNSNLEDIARMIR